MSKNDFSLTLNPLTPRRTVWSFFKKELITSERVAEGVNAV